LRQTSTNRPDDDPLIIPVCTSTFALLSEMVLLMATGKADPAAATIVSTTDSAADTAADVTVAILSPDKELRLLGLRKFLYQLVSASV
jgi:hypothetical protein